AAEAWGSRAKAAANDSAPMAEQPKSRWWKASLTGGAPRVDPPLKPAARKPALAPLVRKPADVPKLEDGDAYMKSGASGRGAATASSSRNSRRSQAPIPTVVPPLALARASIRAVERRPAGIDMRSARSRDSAVVVAAPVNGDAEPGSASSKQAPDAVSSQHTPTALSSQPEPATGSVEPVKRPEPQSAEPLLTSNVEADSVLVSKKRVSLDDSIHVESWRAPLVPAAKTPVSEAPGKPNGGSAAQRQGGSAARVPARPPQQGERRERGRAATNSMAAMSANWRFNPNRSKSTVVDGPPAVPAVDIERPASVFTAADMASEKQQQKLVQNGVFADYSQAAERQRSHTHALHSGQVYHSSIPDMSSLLQLSSAPFTSQTTASGYSTAGISSGQRSRVAPSPPLLPSAVLADILDDGELTRRDAGSVQTSVPASSKSSSNSSIAAPPVPISSESRVAAGDAHARARRISSVIGIAAHADKEDNSFGSRGRSSSSLFHGGRGASIASASTAAVGPLTTSAYGDQGLFLWQRPPHDTSYAPAYLPERTQHEDPGAKHPWGQQPALSTTVASRPLYADSMGSLSLGATQAPTFSAFSSGAAMLWTEPAHSAVDPGLHASNRGEHSGQLGRAPRPIGTRSTPAINGARSAQKQSPATQPWMVQYSSKQPPPHVYGASVDNAVPVYNSHAPLESTVSGYSAHMAPENAVSGYSTHMAAAPSAGTASMAPYMVPVSHMADPGAHHLMMVGREHFQPVLLDAFGEVVN
ncbi:hypothetical protein GGF43_005399, partial [Coemansia sp. RSA 2618]